MASRDAGVGAALAVGDGALQARPLAALLCRGQKPCPAAEGDC